MISADRILRSNRKTMSIEVKEDGEVWLRLPYFCSLKRGEDFLKSRLLWIQKKRDTQLCFVSEKKNINENFVLLNGTFLKRIIWNKENISHTEDRIFIPKESTDKEVELYLFLLAKEKLTQRVWELSEYIGVSPSCVRLSKAKRQYGACNFRGKISLSWRLIRAPNFCQDYVIYHELAHLKEMNHSKRFWKIVSLWCPSYKSAVSWFKEKGYLLG